MPNPCITPPTGVCDADGVTLHGYPALGTCTADGAGGYSCAYPPTDVNCAADGQVCRSGGVCSFLLQSIRDAADGAFPVPHVVRDLFVTYVKPASPAGNGFYAQESPTGPGLYFWTDTVTPAVAVGNTIAVTIDQVGTYHGVKEAQVFTVDDNDGLTPSVAAWVQDLSAGGTIDETTESELVRIDNAVLTGGGGSSYTAAYGSGDATTIFYSGFASLTPAPCLGMTLDVQAVAGQYDATYQVLPFRSTDFSGLDASSCSVDDDSNWDFEGWVVSSDPPEDFFKNPTTSFTVAESTAEVHDGAAAAAVTWTTTDNRDLVQTWYAPVTPGGVYTFHAWVLDNDTHGRARVAYGWYDASRALVGTMQYGSYSTDNPEWVEMTYVTGAAPSAPPTDAAFIRCQLRFYDVGTPFTSATIYVDDWALTSAVSFAPTNGVLDSWTTTSPDEPRRFYDAVTPTMDIWSGINDAGVLYLATNEVTAGWGSDHVLYVWVGAPSTTATVVPPWSKAGTVPAPGAATGSALFALVQEESNGYSEVLRYSGTAWTAVAAPVAASGFDGTRDGTGVVEATVDLVTALALADARLVPSDLYFAVTPYGTNDSGTLVNASQFPRPTTHVDGNLDGEELLLVRRSAVLVGNVL